MVILAAPSTYNISTIGLKSSVDVEKAREVEK
jgi:hypothetical protein